MAFISKHGVGCKGQATARLCALGYGSCHLKWQQSFQQSVGRFRQQLCLSSELKNESSNNMYLNRPGPCVRFVTAATSCACPCHTAVVPSPSPFPPPKAAHWGTARACSIRPTFPEYVSRKNAQAVRTHKVAAVGDTCFKSNSSPHACTARHVGGGQGQATCSAAARGAARDPVKYICRKRTHGNRVSKCHHPEQASQRFQNPSSKKTKNPPHQEGKR